MGSLAFNPSVCCGRAEDGQTECVQPGQTGPTETGRGDPGTSGRATTRTIPTCEDMTIFLKQIGSVITGFYHDRIFSDKTPMLGAR